MMRRGCRVLFIHFHSYPILSRASQEKARELAKLLTRFQYHSRLFLVPFGEIQQRVVLAVPPPLRVVVYRRLMMRIAERIARMHRAQALVTGDVVGQVASQTLENMATIGSVVTLPVLRPLVGMDKEEITAEAQRLGTYPISIIPGPGLLHALHAEASGDQGEAARSRAGRGGPADRGDRRAGGRGRRDRALPVSRPYKMIVSTCSGADNVKMTPGKLAGMKAVSDDRGVIAAAAMDQRGSLQKALAKERGGSVGDKDDGRVQDPRHRGADPARQRDPARSRVGHPREQAAREGLRAC